MSILPLPSGWPRLEPEARLGLAGEILGALEPHTESDPAALLFQLLVAVGNLVGRSPHAIVEGTEHHTNLFAVVVGETSKGRKGTSWDRVLQLLPESALQWRKERMPSGLSSGEGLIAAVKDIKGRDSDDKRLLAFESEFASVLANIEREGNTLSPVLRSAWDNGNLQTLTKNSPAIATGAHISLLGHITREELLRCLRETQAANGFGNRILWCCARRSQLLPEGGAPAPAAIARLKERLEEVITRGARVGLLVRDDAARALWAAIYEQLSAERKGLSGALVSRGEAQVLRLSCIYALLDCSSEVRPAHLKAALAAWRYADASVLYIFGNALGNPTAEKILDELRRSADGLTREEIRRIFGGHKLSKELEPALVELERSALAWRRSEATAGRSAERWFAGFPSAPNALNAREGADPPTLSTQTAPSTQSLTLVPSPATGRRVQ